MTAPQVTPLELAAEAKKPGRRRAVKIEATTPVQTTVERIVQSNRVASARSKAKALAKAQAEAEAAAQAALAAKRAAERRAQAQRRLEERKRQQLIAEELKKPTEDMCLTDHKVSFWLTLYHISLLCKKFNSLNLSSTSPCPSCPAFLVWFFLEQLLHTA